MQIYLAIKRYACSISIYLAQPFPENSTTELKHRKYHIQSLWNNGQNQPPKRDPEVF